MEPQILFNESYVENGDIYVPALIAEGEFWNENGICYASSLLERVHKENEIAGIAHNAHPTGNHPLAYEDQPPDDVAESAKVEFYKKKSHDWGFGTYVKSILRTLENGSKRLIGIFKITDAGAKRAWRERKFPRFVSSSSFVHERNEKGVITDASFVGVSSVKTPAYPPHIAGVDKDCTGGDECLTKLAESSSKRDHYCMYCRYTTLSNLSSHSNGNLSESSMEGEQTSSTEGQTQNNEGDVENKSPIKDLGQTHTDSHGKETETTEGEQEVDYKALYEKLTIENKDLAKKLKTANETNDTNTKDIELIKKDTLSAKIRERLAKVPLFAFDNKEENKEEVVKEFLGFFGKISEKEILSLVEKRYFLAPKIMEISQKKNLQESGLITKDGKLVIPDDKKNTEEFSIGDAVGVFG